MEFLQFDAVICGTGITSALIGATLSCQGKKVLHIDPNSYYGGSHCTLTLKQITNAQNAKNIAPYPQVAQQPQCMQELLGDPPSLPFAFYQLAPFNQSNYVSVYSKLNSEANRISIDLWPKLLYSKSAIVELIIKSGAEPYLRFTDLKGPVLYGYESGGGLQLTQVPNSKSSIFRNPIFTPQEKRMIMRFIGDLFDSVYIPQFSSLSLKSNAPDIGTQGGAECASDFCGSDTWLDFLKNRNCSSGVCNLINYGICMGNFDYPKWDVNHGARRLFKHLESIGVYGDTGSSYLYTLYGTGDLSQAFCRIAAVNGATFMLNTSIECVDLENGQVKLSTDVLVSTRLLLTESTTTPPCLQAITNFDVSKDVTLHILSVLVPFDILGPSACAVLDLPGGPNPIYILQLDSDTGMVPSCLFLVYAMVLDASPPVNVQEFSPTANNVVGTLLTALGRLFASRNVNLDLIDFIMYNWHRINSDFQNSVKSAKADVLQDNTMLHVTIPSPTSDPILPLVEEMQIAAFICNLLQGKDAEYGDAYGRVDFEPLANSKVVAPHEPHETGALASLEYIIEKFST